MNAVRQLRTLGQSVWLDTIQRGMLDSGELERLRDEGVSGITSNPTIFEQAITRSADYDRAIREMASIRPRRSATDVFYALAVDDIRRAADVFRPVFEESGRRDGMVSIEVSPGLAHDVAGTIAEARGLWERIDRPNLMVKVPATAEGLPAIERLTADGVNVNVTLLFSVDRYRDVIAAYLAGLEARLGRGLAIDGIVSVASFFVSRIDVKVDKALDRLAAQEEGDRRDAVLALRGKAAIANAKLAYQEMRRAFGAGRFERLRAAGGGIQRLLWGSTGTKNPAYSDVLYVDSLIGPDTVNTVPLATYRAFQDHGSPRATIETDLEGARSTLDALARHGLDLAAVTRELEAEGVAAFQESFRGLLAALDRKQGELELETVQVRRR
jgi:transaldolase